MDRYKPVLYGRRRFTEPIPPNHVRQLLSATSITREAVEEYLGANSAEFGGLWRVRQVSQEELLVVTPRRLTAASYEYPPI